MSMRPKLKRYLEDLYGVFLIFTTSIAVATVFWFFRSWRAAEETVVELRGELQRRTLLSTLGTPNSSSTKAIPAEQQQKISAGTPYFGEEIYVYELKDLLQQNANILLVDVRPDFHYEQGHIPGAVNWDQGEFAEWEPRKRERMKKSGRVILYCWDKKCESSKDVAARLKEAGHENISVLLGGLDSWKRAEFPVAKGK